MTPVPLDPSPPATAWDDALVDAPLTLWIRHAGSTWLSLTEVRVPAAGGSAVSSP
jgi:hypothetical protein